MRTLYLDSLNRSWSSSHPVNKQAEDPPYRNPSIAEVTIPWEIFQARLIHKSLEWQQRRIPTVRYLQT